VNNQAGPESNATPQPASGTPLPSARPQPPRRIIVIDDNSQIHDDFRKTLTGSQAPAALNDLEAAIFDEPVAKPDVNLAFELEHATQGRDGFRMVEKAIEAGNPFSVAFVDMRMPPGWDGVETVENLWRADPDLQVVICTAYADYSWEEISARLGFTDQLLILKKPFDSMEVRQIAAALSEKWRLARQARLRMDELERMVAERTLDLRRAALHDKLTGLPNRACFYERIETMLRRSKADPSYQFSVLFIDFDRFKVVNDSLGHEVGDKLLIAIADRLYLGVHGPVQAAVRSTAGKSFDVEGSDGSGHMCARLGGDEFVIALDGLHTEEQIRPMVQRIMEIMARPYCINGHEIQSTASIGVSTTVISPQNREELLRDADTAMYRAKSAGRNRWIMFDPHMHDEAVCRMSLEGDLRRAILADELILHYQPIVNVESGRLTGFESLVRWHHPTRGVLRPDQFIQVAEETGLIIPLTNKLINQACAQLAEWSNAGPVASRLSVNVNLSQRQMSDPALTGIVANALKSHGVGPDRLQLEITETSIMDDPDRALGVIQSLRTLGIRLYMDDFGSGHSSLNCLHRFPLDGIKVDRQFIATVAERRDYTAVVHAIVSLAHNLGMRVVAEGVETEEQRTMLLALECDDGQGFLWGRAIPAAQVPEFIAQWGGVRRAA
jgi:diguanylate cyclase